MTPANSSCAREGTVVRNSGCARAAQCGSPDSGARHRGDRESRFLPFVELKYESKNSLLHGHDPKMRDMIVCWRHNWNECPEEVEVIELSKIFGWSVIAGDRKKQNLWNAEERGKAKKIGEIGNRAEAAGITVRFLEILMIYQWNVNIDGQHLSVGFISSKSLRCVLAALIFTFSVTADVLVKAVVDERGHDANNPIIWIEHKCDGHFGKTTQDHLLPQVILVAPVSESSQLSLDIPFAAQTMAFSGSPDRESPGTGSTNLRCWVLRSALARSKRKSHIKHKSREALHRAQEPG
jgi:hypothetical protein